jgi:hypothetical protein
LPIFRLKTSRYALHERANRAALVRELSGASPRWIVADLVADVIDHQPDKA